MSRTGKCHNFAHCIRAYRNDTITLGENDEPNCPECGEPLKMGGSSGGGKSSVVFLLLVLVLVLVLAGAALLFYMQAKRLTPASGAATVEVQEEEVAAPPATSPTPAAATAPPDSAEPESVSVPAEIDLDTRTERNRQVKEEVLSRIDLMPTISADNKDKLYVSVERARQMGKIINIPFGFGQRTLTEQDEQALLAALASPQIQSVMEDPTAVFVILGFADTKGDPDKNLKISLDRAQVVLDTLRDKLGVLNVMHAVGMGGSTLFDEEGLEKNRVVEVWAVLP